MSDDETRGMGVELELDELLLLEGDCEVEDPSEVVEVAA
jgi:hypothetical protein